MPIRKNVDVRHDPYLPWAGLKEVAVCERCGAMYHHKRWSKDAPPSLREFHTTHPVICPACRKIQDRFAEGVLTLRGEFFLHHKEEIINRIRNEEARAVDVNPLERIISIEDLGDHVEVSTTTERFAQRIGREIERAYKGKAVYRWSSGNEKSIRVEWQRD
jgi:NMD protein affecting ribosome stability and mRNA decay